MDGVILYKYLESPLFAIASRREIEVKGGISNELVVYIIEGSTGRVIHQFYEKKVLFDYPIRMVLDENSLVLTFV